MKQWILMLVTVLGFDGCTNLMELQAPKVSVTAVRPVAGKGMLPNFEIDLHLSNPNDQELSLRGASYSLSLEGSPLVSGVASKLPAPVQAKQDRHPSARRGRCFESQFTGDLDVETDNLQHVMRQTVQT